MSLASIQLLDSIPSININVSPVKFNCPILIIHWLTWDSLWEWGCPPTHSVCSGPHCTRSRLAQPGIKDYLVCLHHPSLHPCHPALHSYIRRYMHPYIRVISPYIHPYIRPFPQHASLHCVLLGVLCEVCHNTSQL